MKEKKYGESRSVQISDTSKLNLFYIKVYGKHHIINNQIHHLWQFKQNPFNNFEYKSIAITENENEITSHLGFIPIELKVFNHIKTGSWYMMQYTLENYRGKGFGNNLVKFGQNVFDFVMALNSTEDATKSHMRNGWIDLKNMNRHIAILNKKRLENFLGHTICEEVKLSNEINSNFVRTHTLDAKYNDFWNSVSQRYPITVNRTKEYLLWRFLNHPFLDYHFMTLYDNENLVGFVVIRIEDNNDNIKATRIVDLIVFEKYENVILQNIINYLRNKVDFIDFYSTGYFYNDSLKKSNFFNNLNTKYNIPSVFDPIDVNRKETINFHFKCNDENLSKSNVFNDINLWYFVKGDSDADRAV